MKKHYLYKNIILESSWGCWVGYYKHESGYIEKIVSGLDVTKKRMYAICKEQVDFMNNEYIEMHK